MLKGKVLRPIPGTGYSAGELASFTDERAEKYAEYLENKDYFEKGKAKKVEDTDEDEDSVDPANGTGDIDPAEVFDKIDDEDQDGEDEDQANENPEKVAPVKKKAAKKS